MTHLDGLISRYGVIRSVSGAADTSGVGDVWTYQADLGSGFPGRGVTAHNRLLTGGRAVGDGPLARLLAIAEGAERYAANQFTTAGVVVASANALGHRERILDPARYPRCSAAEYADPECPLRPFDPDAPIRWTKGVDLRDGGDVWVPLVMAAYRAGHAMPAEHFWSGISTGYAVHTDPAAALFGGISEVVERDMISLIWLQRLRPPRIPVAALPAEVRGIVAASRRRFVETVLFDATSDVGIPLVYVVQRAPYDDVAHTLVGCGAGLTVAEAARKALLETVGFRSVVHDDSGTGTEIDDIVAGAREMGVRERAAAFDFLLSGDDPGPAAAPWTDPGPYAADPAAAVARAVDRLAELDMAVVAVDRTTAELASVGLVAVNVIIPDLQPMTFADKAQYRGHPRLYDGPARMGYPVHPEEELSPWPQPFA